MAMNSAIEEARSIFFIGSILVLFLNQWRWTHEIYKARLHSLDRVHSRVILTVGIHTVIILSCIPELVNSLPPTLYSLLIVNCCAIYSWAGKASYHLRFMAFILSTAVPYISGASEGSATHTLWHLYCHWAAIYSWARSGPSRTLFVYHFVIYY